MAELLHGDLRANVKSGMFWPCGPAIIASIMQEPEEEVVAAMKETRGGRLSQNRHGFVDRMAS